MKEQRLWEIIEDLLSNAVPLGNSEIKTDDLKYGLRTFCGMFSVAGNRLFELDIALKEHKTGKVMFAEEEIVEEKNVNRGLSADCKLGPELVVAIAMRGREHPCDRCNHDRKECRGFPRTDQGGINKL